MFVCVQMLVCVRVNVHMMSSKAVVPREHIYLACLRDNPSLTQTSPSRLGLSTQGAPSIFLLLPSQHWDYEQRPPCLASNMD